MNNNDKSKHNVDDIFDLMSDEPITNNIDDINITDNNVTSELDDYDSSNLDFHYDPSEDDIVYDSGVTPTISDIPTYTAAPKKSESKAEVKKAEDTSKEEKKYKKRKKYLTPEEKHQRMMSIIYAVVGIVAVYVIGFYYIKYLNNEYYNDLYASLPVVSKDISYNIEKTDNSSSSYEKESFGLSLFKIDTDNDGLTDYYEINVSHTDPANPDSDGDGLSDGIEFIAGLDPLSEMSDGTTADIDRIFERTISNGLINVYLKGNAEIYNVSLKNSVSQINNYPGAVTELFGITGVNENIEAYITYGASDNDSNNNIVLVKSNIKDNTFENISFNDGKAIISSGNDVLTDYYFIADSTVFSDELPIEIMLLIDNSGSMYPAELVDNSEANDIDFKRVDFAENIINSFDNTSFGIAKFTGSYTLLNHITSDKDALLSSVASIRTGNEYFNGTEISLSIMSAIQEFENPSARRYLIMITDGLPSVVNTENEQLAIDMCKDKNISVISIGLGQKIDPDYLSLIAEETNGRFFKAINNLAFTEIYNQINDLIYKSDVNAISIDTTDETALVESLLIGKTGFEKKDYLSLINVPLDDDLTNMNLGAAIFSMLYYSGDLPLNAAGYIRSDGTEIDGYKLDSFALLIDGKANLSELSIECVNNYNNYLDASDKWNIKNITNGHLAHTVDTNVIINQNSLRTIRIPFAFEDIETTALSIARTLTFQRVKSFNSYDCAVINTALLNGNDAEIIKAVTYYENIIDTQKYQIYSFGVDGNITVEYLINVIRKGLSPILTIDGQIYNVTSISGVIGDDNSYVLEMMEISNDCKMCSLVINGNQIYTDNAPDYQYTVTLNNAEVNAYILAIKD